LAILPWRGARRRRQCESRTSDAAIRSRIAGA
jgi:hypothetical protein